MKRNFALQTPYKVSYTITSSPFMLDTTQQSPEVEVELSNISSGDVIVVDQEGATMDTIEFSKSKVYRLTGGFYIPVSVRSIGAGSISIPPHDHDNLYYTKTEIDNGYATINHNHNNLYNTKAEITALLSAKANTSHNHTVADITDLTSNYYNKSQIDTSLSSKADLVGGFIPTSQIPAIAISDYLGGVSSLAGLTSLSGQVGDWASIDTGNDTGTYIITTGTGSQSSDWKKLPVPASGASVTSVNGQTGVVVLGKADIGLGNIDNTSDLNKPISTATQTALDNTVKKTGDESISGLKVFGNKLEALDIIKISGGASSTENLTAGGGAGRFGLVAGYLGTMAGRLLFGDGTGWRFGFSTGLPNNPTDIMVMRDTGEIYGNFLFPQGHMTNGKIVTSVTSGTLTVAIKTLSGNDPSITEPVYIRIGNTVRKLTQSAFISPSAGGDWCNLSNLEMQNQEVDLFVYLGWSTSVNRVVIGVSRISHGRIHADFSSTGSDERFLMEFQGMNGSDELEVVGRINAILSNTQQWSIPATPVIINRPIFESRLLTYSPQGSVSGGGFSLGNGTLEGRYIINKRMIDSNIRFNCGSTTNMGTGQVSFSLPLQNNISFYGLQVRTVGGGSGVAYNGGSYALTPVTNDYNGNGGVFWLTAGSANSGVVGANNPFTWGAGCYAGVSWSYGLV